MNAILPYATETLLISTATEDHRGPRFSISDCLQLQVHNLWVMCNAFREPRKTCTK